MKPEEPHVPAPPASPEPPAGLAELAGSLRHPEVTRTGLTTTADGRWALLVRVRPGTPTPLPEVEAACREHPVVYQEDRPGWTIARPAYPGRGE